MTPEENESARVNLTEPDTQQPDHLCHIHDHIQERDDINDVRENVCRNLATTEHIDGKYYCLLHLPTKDKAEKFNFVFEARLKEIDDKVAKIEADFPEDKDKQATQKNNLTYDFRYVWFPAIFNGKRKYLVTANFSSATFSAAADFSSAKFLEHSQIFFWSTDFCRIVSFGRAIIEGDVEFDNVVFWDQQQIQNAPNELKIRFEELQEKRKELGISDLIDPQAYLSLEKVQFSNPERISFNSMSLRPCWFVNVEDARKIVFNDVEWRNIEIDVDRAGLDEEFSELTKRNVERPRESLIKACNQLADNAEANRRFDEARKFRKQAIALKQYKCHIHDTVDSSDKDSIREAVCQQYPVVNEDGGNYYCLWHNPGTNKAEIFLQEFMKRRDAGHTDFRGVTFPISIKFSGDLPKKLDFSGATFERRVAFEQATIHQIKFDKAYFTEDSELVFEESYCVEKISLKEAIFDGKFYLKGSSHQVVFISRGSLSLEDIRFDKPNQVNFRSVRLRPHYFVNVDASKFNFHDCDWKDIGEKKLNIHEEIKRCSGSNKSLAQVCNQLAINYEESRNFEESSGFRYTAMEAKRLDNRGLGKIFNLYWIYKWSSGYGENWRRAAVVLIGLLVLFGYLYAMPFASFDYGNPKPKPADTAVQRACDKVRIIGNTDGMNVCDGIVHSLSVATFQRPEPKSADFLTRLIVVFELIFVPLQAALLALAIRRKFMR